jgi:hypothetical protein
MPVLVRARKKPLFLAAFQIMDFEIEKKGDKIKAKLNQQNTDDQNNKA